MHFWIDKRSQCGYSGRRVPPSLSTGVGRTRRERHLKPMVTPVHRFQSVECVAGPARPHHPLQHTQRITHNHYSNSGGTHTSNGVHPPSGAVRGAPEADTSLYLEPPPEGAPRGHVGPPPPPLMPAHLKCGMWASFALATIFVASAKFYFDHQMLYEQGSGMEVLVFCGLLVVLLLGACTVSLCRARVPPPLPLPPLTAPPIVVQQDSSSDLSLGTMLSLQAAVPVPATLPVAPVPPPPPPYHIAVLLPSRPVTEAPPPSYEKAIS